MSSSSANWLGYMALELGYEGNHQAHQVILWNSDPNPNLGTFNTSISSASLQEIQPACSTCQSVGNGLSMTSSFGYGNYAAGSVKVEKRFTHGLQFLTSYVWSHALANSGTPLSGSSNLAPDFEYQLGDRIFQRIVGYPAQLDHQLQLRIAVRQGQAIRRQHEPRCRRGRRRLADERHPDAADRRCRSPWRAPIATASGAAACPITLPGYTGNGNTRASRRTHS